MKKELQSIANQLSESDIREIIRIKKFGDKKTIAIRRKRDKMAATLAKLDAQLAKLGVAAETEAPKRPRGRLVRAKGEVGRTSRAKKETNKEAPAKRGGRTVRGGKRKSGRRNNLSIVVREIFRQADAPLKASQIVDALPMAGIPVDDVSEMRKRISVVLASQKNHFDQVERGVYRLKD